MSKERINKLSKKFLKKIMAMPLAQVIDIMIHYNIDTKTDNCGLTFHVDNFQIDLNVTQKKLQQSN